MEVCRKLRPRESYCSAAYVMQAVRAIGFHSDEMTMESTETTCGSMSSIFCAALLFLLFMATANGERPALSLAVRSRRPRQEFSRRSIRGPCAFSMEMCRGVLPSASYARVVGAKESEFQFDRGVKFRPLSSLTLILTSAPCSNSAVTTSSSPHWQQRWSGVAWSLASSPPRPSAPGRRGLFTSQPERTRKQAESWAFSSMHRCNRVCWHPSGPSPQPSVSTPCLQTKEDVVALVQ